MFPATEPVISELSRKVAACDEAGRDNMLIKLGDLFSGVSHLLDDAGLDTFDTIFLSLAPVCGQTALKYLSESIAPNPRAPRRSIRRLAFHDEILIARPVITLSPLLLDEDQLALATVKSTEHVLALCERSTLTTGVTDIILSRADGRVRVALARNEGAKLSRRGRERLLEAALEDDELDDVVQKRPDLSEERPSSELVPVNSDAGLRFHTVLSAAELEQQIIALLRSNEVDNALQRLSKALAVPPLLVSKAFAIDAHGGFLAYARSADLSWDAVEMFLKRRYETGSITPQLQRARRDFEMLKIGDARRVVSLLIKHAPGRMN